MVASRSFVGLACVGWLAAICSPVLAQITAPLAKPASVILPKIEPPTMPGGRQEIALPASIDEVVVGGGGRYLVLQFKALSKLGIFDVNQLKIVGYVPAPDAEITFAAGATKLIVASGDSGVITRYDLGTQTKELTQTLDLGTKKLFAVMGSASAGPLVLGVSDGSYGAKFHTVDVETLRAAPLNTKGYNSSGTNIRIAADGSALGIWASGLSPSGLNCLLKTGDVWTSYHEHESVGYVVPSPNGKLLYTADGIYTYQLRRVGTRNRSQANDYPIPAAHGPFYLAVIGSPLPRGGRDEETKESVALKMEGDERALATIPNLDPVWDRSDQWSRGALTLEKRLIFVPDANLVLQIAQSKDKLIAVQFDVNQSLASSSVDFLLVTSRPPLSLQAGDKLSYQIVAKSKSPEVTYSLDSAPAGMQISPTGLLTWTTTSKSPAASNIIISVGSKSGQQTFHTFTLNVQGGDSGASSVAAASARPAATGTAQLLATTPTDVGDSKSVQLPGTVADVCVGGNGRFLLLYFRDLKKIGVFDVSQAKLEGYLPAADDETRFAAGATRAVVFNVSQGVVARYRLATLEREVSLSNAITDSIQYVATGAGSEGPLLLRTLRGQGQLDQAGLQFMDLNTLKPISVKWPSGRIPHMVYRDLNRIYASTSGAVFSVTGLGVIRLSGDSVQYVGSSVGRGFGEGIGGYPAADASHYLLNGRLLNSDQQPIGDQTQQGFGIGIPSVTGRYYLSFKQDDLYSSRGTSGKQAVKLFMFGDNRPLLTIQDLPVGLGNVNDGHHGFGMGWEKRIFFIPDAQVIVTLPATNDRLEMRRLNIDEALEASGVDYLVVDSQPPGTATLGKLYSYDIRVKSKKGGVKFTLDSSPQGMQISAVGKLTWQVPATLAEAKQSVVISVSDSSGQSTFHTFAIEVPELAAKAEVEKKQQEEQRLLAQQEAQRKLQEQRQAEQAAAAQRMKEQAELRAQQLAQKNAKPALRTWTDNTGDFKITAVFVEILDKKSVVLSLENGEIRKVPLVKLSEADIYEAVRLDLQRLGAAPGTGESPFKKE